MTSPSADLVAPMDGAVASLAREFDVLPREDVGAVLADSLARLGPSRTRASRPAQAYRFARERLADAAVAGGAVPRTRPVVLFVDGEDAAHAPLAAALLQQAADGQVVVRSAGSDPAQELLDGVVDVLAEAGIDAGSAFPKPLTPEVLEVADLVVTLGGGGDLHLPPGRRRLDWDVPDLARADAERLRTLRDDLADRVRLLLHEVLHPGAGHVLDDAVLRLLADPLRARVVELLAGEALCTSHLVELTGAKQSNVSNHLKLLREAGLVRTEPCGRFTYNLLDPGRLRALGEGLLALADAADAGVPRRACP